MKYAREDKFTAPRTAADILKLALEKEKSSFSFYGYLISKTKDSALIRLLERLKAAEAGHILNIKRALEK